MKEARDPYQRKTPSLFVYPLSDGNGYERNAAYPSRFQPTDQTSPG